MTDAERFKEQVRAALIDHEIKRMSEIEGVQVLDMTVPHEPLSLSAPYYITLSDKRRVFVWYDYRACVFRFGQDQSIPLREVLERIRMTEVIMTCAEPAPDHVIEEKP